MANQLAEQPWRPMPAPSMLTLSEATVACATDAAVETVCEEFRSAALRLARGGDRGRKQRLLPNAPGLEHFAGVAPCLVAALL